ncbi:MAG: signal peptidase I [Sphingomonas sp.]
MASDNLAINADPMATEDSATGGTDWWAEIRGLLWLVLAVLGFHSLIAKPFYIPSESMLPGLLVGDHLIVTKYPYGYSYISPTFHVLPFFHGRLLGRLPERGDIVVAVPPHSDEDYIKRVIGLPGDRLEVRDGVVILNGKPVKRGPLHYVDIANYGGDAQVEGGVTCDPAQYPAGSFYRDAKGVPHCRLPIVTETLPNGRTYDTVELGLSVGDNYGPITVPAGHVFLMGDNRDRSADSRFPLQERGLGGPVPWENLGGRAEFISHSFTGKASYNPFTWWGALRSGRAGTSLRPAQSPK